MSSNPTSFNPTSIGGLQLWLDGADSSTLTLASGAISQWSDKSGQGNNATQSTASGRPAAQSASINGLSAVHFDGSASFLTLNTPIAWLPSTIFVVARYAANATGGSLLGDASQDTFGLNAGNLYIYAPGVSADAAYVPDGNAHVFGASLASGSSMVSVDGSTVATGAGTTGRGFALIGCRTLEYFGGPIGEVLVYGALTPGQQAQVLAYLQGKWATPPTMPAPASVLSTASPYGYAASPVSGTWVAPTANQVQAGVKFGPGNSLTGTASGSWRWFAI